MVRFYIPSKGRHDNPKTSLALTRMGVKHYLVVDETDADAYRDAISRHGLRAEVLVLDRRFYDEYQTCDDLGDSKSKGPGPKRNFAWQHSIEQGYASHWIMDDNIRRFYRLNKNRQFQCESAGFWDAMDCWLDKYSNIGMAGPAYNWESPAHKDLPPFKRNRHIFSCNWIRNDIPQRWRGRYNEDAILSLDILKAGLCTVSFRVFTQDKSRTQTCRGGNTEDVYHVDGTPIKGKSYALGGTTPKSQMMVSVHGDVSKVVKRYGRVHHAVDYSGFTQRLRRKKSAVRQVECNEFGMKLKARRDD